MKDKNIKMKKFILLSTLYFYGFTIFKPATKEDFKDKYYESTYVDNISAYSKCKLGDIYIGTPDYIERAKEINEGRSCIYILDFRYRKENPDVQIIDSYCIRDEEAMDEILYTIIRYNEENPSNWNRTFYSMKLEWKMHNFLYDLDYNVESTKDVDLDNDDEKWYNYKKLIYK